MIRKGPSTAASADGPTNTTKKPKVVAMPAKAEKAPKTPKVAKAPKAPPVRKFLGATTGLSVRDFQNKLMKDNFKAKLTDAQLAQAMRAEFPTAVPYTEKHVAGIRSGWNKGKHGNDVPPKPLSAYDAEGNVIEGRQRKMRELKPPTVAPAKAARIVKRASATA